MTVEKKNYLAVIQLKADSDIQRLARDVPEIINYLSRLSDGEQELAFRSNDRLLFGYFLKTNKPQFLQAEFDKCDGTSNGDHLLVVEVGNPIGGTSGFARAWTWLQRH